MPLPTSPRNPLILRLLLQIIQPETLQIRVHRWVAFLASFLSCYLLWGRRYFSEWPVFVGGTLLVLTSAAASTAITAYIVNYTYGRYSEPEQARRRLLTNALGLCLMGIVLTGSALWFFDALHVFGYHYDARTGPWFFAIALTFDLLLAGTFEISFAFQQWQRSQRETEQLAEHLQRQLNDVKQQVNPHFLFNSLSSLSVLISESPAQAERFVDELAQVYRYLLQVHPGGPRPVSTHLVPLEAELRFLQSYAYLLRIRYGASLHLVLAPTTAYLPGHLLPLTLQTLVDNAIRHNVVSAARPLHLVVEPAAGGVRVRNTRRPRPQRIPVVRGGLADLQVRYQQLGNSALLVEVAADSFTVTIPLHRG